VVKLQNVLLKEMITAQDIKFILESDVFGSELEELSSYAANIRQERPIVMLIANFLAA
jgi:hypothetical protein